MHRDLSITVPAERSEALCRELQALEGVIGLTLNRGASRKPPGDVLVVHALNRATDEILRLVAVAREAGPVSVTTAELASLIDPDHQEAIEDDTDEAIWEEMETGLRQQARVTPNYLVLMALGGSIATVGLVSGTGPRELYFISSAIIAPGLESLGKLSLGLVLRRGSLVWRATKSFLSGYTLVVLASAITYLLLQASGLPVYPEFTENEEVQRLAHPGARELLVSGCGALAGMVMYSTYRESVIAGPLIAMVIIPAAAMLGMAVVAQRWDLAGEALQRLGLDLLLITGAGVA
ncbi:MAG: DUF389 domain-containing protein, partial [Bryobacteraceae bacterium]